MFLTSAGLILNCGYARTAIFQLYHQDSPGRPKKASTQNRQQTCVPATEASIEQETNHDSMHNIGSTHGECDNTHCQVDVNMPHNESDSTQYGECSANSPPNNETDRVTTKTRPPQDPLQAFKHYFPLNTCNLNETVFQTVPKKANVKI